MNNTVDYYKCKTVLVCLRFRQRQEMFFFFLCLFVCNQKNGIHVLQEYGEIEAEFAKVGTERVLLEMLTYRNTGPILLPKGKSYDYPVSLPSWLTEHDVKYYVSKYEKSGFTGPVNYYRNMDRYVSRIRRPVNNSQF